MTAPAADDDAEREIDLSGWRDALVARWWIVAAGVAAGIVVGAIYSLSGGSTQEAAVLIAPGQPFTANGSPVQNYVSSPRAINVIATDPSSLKAAAAAAHIPRSELRGHVRTETVSTGAGSAAARGTVLVRLIVSGKKRLRVEQAADALAVIVKDRTTPPFVRQSLATLKARTKSINRRLSSIEQQIDAYNETLRTEDLQGLDKLVLVTELDAAISRQGNLSDRLFTNDERLSLIENVEIAQILTPNAVAEKTTARSRRNSILVGLLIGLIVGAIAALVVDRRADRARPA